MPGALPAHTTPSVVPIHEPHPTAEGWLEQTAGIDEHGGSGLVPGLLTSAATEMSPISNHPTHGAIAIAEAMDMPNKNIDTSMADTNMPIAKFGPALTPMSLDLPPSTAEGRLEQTAVIDGHGASGRLVPGLLASAAIEMLPISNRPAPEAKMDIPNENIDTSMADADIPTPGSLDLPPQDDKPPSSLSTRFSGIFSESSGKGTFSFGFKMPSMLMVCVSAVQLAIDVKSLTGGHWGSQKVTPNRRGKPRVKGSPCRTKPSACTASDRWMLGREFHIAESSACLNG